MEKLAARWLMLICLLAKVFYFESICMLYLAKAGQCYLWELRRGIVTIIVMSLSHSQALRGNTEMNKQCILKSHCSLFHTLAIKKGFIHEKKLQTF